MIHDANTMHCAICGGDFPAAQLTECDHDFLCPNCLENETLTCVCCGRRIRITDNCGDSETPLCESCYDDEYNHCTRCGTLIHRRDTYYRDDCDDDPYCAECYHAMQRDAIIHDYCYKPDPVFCGNGSRFLGVELEIDEGGEDTDNAQRILDIANSDAENIYIKHDGSLEEGFEIVTHPMTLDYHLHEMPWEDVLEEAKEMGYTSHQADTCGLHVHVNRSAFGEDITAQECGIARVLYLVEKFWDEFLKFSRRSTEQLEQWARRYGYKDHPQILMDAVKDHNTGRYMAINLTNRDTIEFRLWRGTLKLNTLLATLQMVDHICEVAFSLSDEDIQQMSWTSFVAGCCDYPELVQYLKERRLYVNDPVISSAEV